MVGGHMATGDKIVKMNDYFGTHMLLWTDMKEFGFWWQWLDDLLGQN